ncbi:MAG TPA: hypothetical protein VKB46_09990, partial [Pyrinomonadaceae bacterium]|nr:hypothetical protein [Pyrinomonadaceae bacterium]
NVVTGLGLGGWGDLLFHIRAAVFFAEQGGWPNQSFFLAGQPVGYAFLADFISGLFWRLGFSIGNSFTIPTILLAAFFLLAFEWVVIRLTKSVRAAILSVVLFMGFGGLSGWSILPELSPDTWAKLRTLPHGITVWREQNYAVLNPFVMMLHQRSFLLGFPLFVVLLFLSWKFLEEKSLKVLGAITFAAILLAFFHPFTWLAFLMVFPAWMFWLTVFRVRSFSRRELLMTCAALALMALGGFLVVKGLQPSAGASSITLKIGWLATDISWIQFWIKNIGLYLVLGPLTVIYFWQRNRMLALLVLAGFTPFVAANLFQFAPWDWDNTKVFAPSWLILTIGVGSLISSWWEQDHPGVKMLALACLPILMLSGALEVARVIAYRSEPMVITSVADLSLGEAVRARLGKSAVLLTEPEASHPVFMYSGRPSFVAYEGWLWSQAWKGKYEQRLLDAKSIYQGNDASRELIKKNQIDYVVIGPPEVKAGANKQWFDSNYPAVLTQQDYTLFDVRGRGQTTQAKEVKPEGEL